jgi:hypothetical protein
VLAGVFLIAIIGLAGSVEHYTGVQAYARNYTDSYAIGQQDARFAGLKQALSAATVIGYVSDLPQSDPRGSSMFFGAQYALAPHVLIRNANASKYDVIVGNFSKPMDAQEEARKLNAATAQDFGFGVMLFRKAAR